MLWSEEFSRATSRPNDVTGTRPYFKANACDGVPCTQSVYKRPMHRESTWIVNTRPYPVVVVVMTA